MFDVLSSLFQTANSRHVRQLEQLETELDSLLAGYGSLRAQRHQAQGTASSILSSRIPIRMSQPPGEDRRVEQQGQEQEQEQGSAQEQRQRHTHRQQQQKQREAVTVEKEEDAMSWKYSSPSSLSSSVDEESDSDASSVSDASSEQTAMTSHPSHQTHTSPDTSNLVINTPQQETYNTDSVEHKLGEELINERKLRIKAEARAADLDNRLARDARMMKKTNSKYNASPLACHACILSCIFAFSIYSLPF